MRLIDQPFPPAPAGQREAHRGRCDVEVAVEILFLGIAAAQELQVKAAGMHKIGIGRRRGVLLGGAIPVRPIVEQVGEQLLGMGAITATVDPAAAHHPGVRCLGVELL
ncbi:MAG: hypothetical protein WCO82_04280, partial [Sphingomonadales bacterium]